VLVPERRGYGKSEGPRFSQEIGADRGVRYVARMRAEAGDVNAATEFILTHAPSSIDARRIAIMGTSFGGIVTTLAAADSTRYAAAIVQAPGALNWRASEALRQALIAAAVRILIPLSCAVAENDATTESTNVRLGNQEPIRMLSGGLQKVCILHKIFIWHERDDSRPVTSRFECRQPREPSGSRGSSIRCASLLPHIS
jgi:pimeloyl-ACP methyl ester carboxylesterase